MAEITELAPAKVNIALDIVERREDGYHEMRMINHSIGLSDVLTFSDSDRIELLCEDPEVPAGEDNLVVRVAVALREQYSVEKGAAIHLEKHIPMQAGLAGGSADAAAAIRGLNRLWQLNMTSDEMRNFGAGFGADIPYCLYNGTALVEGFGEIITPLPALADFSVLVVKPDIAISTPEAFKMADREKGLFHPDISVAADCLHRHLFFDALETMGNSFEKPIFERWPAIGKIKEALLQYGAFYATMSGSGSTVIGYFNDDQAAGKAFNAISSQEKNIILTAVKDNRG